MTDNYIFRCLLRISIPEYNPEDKNENPTSKRLFTAKNVKLRRHKADRSYSSLKKIFSLKSPETR